MKNLKNILLYVLVGLLFIVGVGGFIYLYAYTRAHEQANESIVQNFQPDVIRQQQIVAELAAARTKAEASAATLSAMMNTYVAQTALNGGLETTYNEVAHYVNQTNAIFNSLDSSKPSTKSLGVDATRARIDVLKQEIQATLAAWQATTDKISKLNQPDAALTSQANTYLDKLETYLHELQAIINSLTPDNSGLTASEIAFDQTLMDTVAGDVAAAAGDLHQDENSAGVKISGDKAVIVPITINDIQNQQNIVNQLKVRVSSIQEQALNYDASGDSTINSSSVGNPSGGSNGSTGGSSGGTSGQDYTPTPTTPPDMTGKPKLIEGTNTI